MKKTCFSAAVLFLFYCTAANAQSWTTIASDGTGDGASSSLLDGTKLEFWQDAVKDSLYFRITAASISGAQSSNFGVNVMVKIPGSTQDFNFWGANNMDAYTKLVSVWVTGTAPSSYSGVIGVANAQGISAQNYTNLSSNNIKIILDQSAKTIVLGMKRKDLVTDAEMGATRTLTLKTAAAVGSSSSWNDDIYASSATMTLANVGTTGISSNTAVSGISIYPNPATEALNINCPNANACYVITDVLGNKIVSGNLDNGITRVQTENLAAGIYLLMVTTGNNILLKEKITIVK